MVKVDTHTITKDQNENLFKSYIFPYKIKMLNDLNQIQLENLNFKAIYWWSVKAIYKAKKYKDYEMDPYA